MEQWRKDLQRNNWEGAYMNSRDTEKFLESESAQIKAVLTELGLAK